jgi:hypothetical protein
MNYTNLVKKYFNAFSNKRIDQLEKLYDNNIYLRDWEINILGKKNVLEKNKSFFDSANKMTINIISLCENKNSIAAEIELVLNNNLKLLIIDLISFEKNKIISIKAFKG